MVWMDLVVTLASHFISMSTSMEAVSALASRKPFVLFEHDPLMSKHDPSYLLPSAED